MVWKTKDELFNDIKEKGLIELDDCFDSNVQIINLLYKKHYTGWQKATYRLLWFPVISEKDDEGMPTSRATWQNFFNQTHSIIYEKTDNLQLNKQKKEWALLDEQRGAIRVDLLVFLLLRDGTII